MELLQTEPGIYRRAISLLLMTGMRRGELLGLEWKDIDYENKIISIVRTSQCLPNRGIITEEPKTKTSKRCIAVPEQVFELLQEQHNWQLVQAKRLKDNWTNTDRVITNEFGEPMRPDRLTKWFAKFVKQSDLPDIHLHSLRHTYATLYIANNVPITTVAAQLGHANVSTTANIYAHAIKSSQIAAAKRLNSLFNIF